MQHGHGHGSEKLEQDTVMRMEDSELRSRRRKVELQHQLEVREREHRGKKRYTMEVDMKGHPHGQNMPLWMTCLWGHAQDVDFSVDNYHMHSTTMLLSIKQRVDNTFDYEGGTWASHRGCRAPLHEECPKHHGTRIRP